MAKTKQLPLVINIRGNSGSGKTHLTREFTALCKRQSPEDAQDQLLLYSKQKWVVLGRYNVVSGGCDRINTQQEIIARCEQYAAEGRNLWLEGLLLSTIYGSVGDYSERYGDRWVFAYLDTPLETCIKRIKQRRTELKIEKPLNESNTRQRAGAIARNAEIARSHGRRVITLPAEAALTPLLKIIKAEAL